MDLQEAARIVFVGYSLPLADFEFRYTLLKAITGRHDVQIRVVLYPPDSPGISPKQRWKRDAEEQRFVNFVGQRDIDFKYMDAVDFMSDPALIWTW